MSFLKAKTSSFLKLLVALSVISYPLLRAFHYTSFYLLVGFSLYIFSVVSFLENFISDSVNKARWVYAFFSAPFLSSIWSMMPYRSLYYSGLLFAFGVIFSISHIVFMKKKIKWIYVASIISIVVFSVTFSLIIFRFGSVRVQGPAKEVVGSISNQIPAVCLPLAPYLYVMWRLNKKRGWVILSSILLILIVVFSESRAAYILLLSYVLLIPVFMSNRITYLVKRIAALALTGLIGAVALYMFVGPQVVGTVLERFSESKFLQGDFNIAQSLDDIQGDTRRLVMLQEAYNIVITDPLTGIGYYTFKPYVEARYPYSAISHNIILTVWGEMGIFGFVSFIGMVTVAFREAGRGQKCAATNGNKEHWLFLGASKAALVVLLVHAMVRPQLTNPTFWVIVAACLGVGWANRVSCAPHSTSPNKMSTVS